MKFESNNKHVRFRLGEEPMGHMNLLLSKGVSLIRGEMGGFRTGLDGVWRPDVLGQSGELRQVLKWKWG